MIDTIYKEDVASIEIFIPGGDSHVVSTEVLLMIVERALKGVKAQRGHAIRGGRTVLAVDADGRVFVGSELIYTPRGVGAGEGAG